MVGRLKVVLVAAAVAWVPVQALANTANELIDQVNQCQMTDPVGLTHTLSVKDGHVVMRDEGGQFVGLTAAMPADKLVFGYQQRSFNPDYGGVLSLQCSDKSQCVDVKRDSGQAWKTDRLQLFLRADCGKTLDLAGKTLPPTTP